MKLIGAFEAKNTLGSLLDLVQGGDEIVITRRGKPVARLVPDRGKIDQNEVLAALQRMDDRAAALPARPFDWPEHKELRDKDRP